MSGAEGHLRQHADQIDNSKVSIKLHTHMLTCTHRSEKIPGSTEVREDNSKQEMVRKRDGERKKWLAVHVKLECVKNEDAVL